MTRRTLGKGLGALLGEQGVEHYEGREVTDYLEEVPLYLIEANPEQPRQFFNKDELSSLKLSIQEKGILQPIIIRPIYDHITNEKKYQIIAGERRWRVASELRFEKIPAIIKECDEKEALEIALIENLQRDDLNPLEEAEAYERLIATYAYTQDVLAKKISKSRSYVSNILRLMQLPDGIKAHLKEGRLTAGHARALLTAQNPEILAQKIIQENLSVRDTENLTKKPSSSSSSKKTNDFSFEEGANEFEEQQKYLSEQISKIIQKPVDLKIRKNGAFLTIHLYSFEEIDDFISQLRSLSELKKYE